jgi:signal transduction histidine kinase
VRSWRYALSLAAGYAAVASLYIVISSALAANVSGSVEELRRIETIKGVIYVTVTALAVLIGAWIAMSRLERAHEEIRRRDAAILTGERKVLAGLLAATTAHDANNVLIGAIHDLETLKQSRGDDPEVKRLALSVDRLVSLNHRLMETVRQGRSGETRELNLLREVRASIEAIRSHQHVRGCSVRTSGPEDLVLTAHPLLVHQIVVNLVVNAAEATEGRGRIDVILRRIGSDALIEVHDDGPGVAAERRAGLFDALETSKPGGTGLGLFSVKACAGALGGAAEVTVSPLGGACFSVRFPLPAAPAGGVATSTQKAGSTATTAA